MRQCGLNKVDVQDWKKWRTDVNCIVVVLVDIQICEVI